MNNYSVVVKGASRVTIRQTSTVNHAIKHGAYASELRLTVEVVCNKTNTVVIEIPAIDESHAIKPSCKRDKRYLKMAKKGV